MKNELQNAYKIISQYEYEINKKKKYSFEGAFVDQYELADIESEN